MTQDCAEISEIHGSRVVAQGFRVWVPKRGLQGNLVTQALKLTWSGRTSWRRVQLSGRDQFSLHAPAPSAGNYQRPP
jgi:trimethylamine:corrinoid methyltransferase-like protein